MLLWPRSRFPEPPTRKSSCDEFGAQDPLRQIDQVRAVILPCRVPMRALIRTEPPTWLGSCRAIFGRRNRLGQPPQSPSVGTLALAQHVRSAADPSLIVDFALAMHKTNLFLLFRFP